MAADKTLHVIGAGLAGSEAAWQAAERGVHVTVHEMRPERLTEAHKTGHCAELVCSNSFRSDDWETNAVGLLHEEMRRAGSLIMQAADRHKLPAGGALAVDRDAFAAEVTERLAAHPRIEIARGEVAGLPPADWASVVIATGPLTTPSLSAAVNALTGEDALAFFDAIAPIVLHETIDMDVAWMQSRYDKPGPGGTGADYINCPLERDRYDAFIDALLAAGKVSFKEWEKTPYFEGCLPIEVMAERGRDTLRFGPMKPVGLTDPRTGRAPYAVVQLRQDNALGTLWNMVGFQTKLKHGEQSRIFRMIPGLEHAAFARLGGLHRNTFLNSPKLLDASLRLKAEPRLRFAGQITGVEGYVEFCVYRPARRAFRRRRAFWRGAFAPASDHRAWRAPRPHHGRPYRGRLGRRAQFPAYECEFRPVPAGAPARRQAPERRRARARAENRVVAPRARRPSSLARRRRAGMLGKCPGAC